MKALEYRRRISLPDERVAVCGDWHGNIGWLRMLTWTLPRLAPDVTTILQLGDWGMDPTKSDGLLAAAGIERVYVTLGNHEPWGQLTPLLAAHPGAQSGWGYTKSYDAYTTVSQARSKLLNCFNCYFPVKGAPAAFPSYGQHLPLVAGPWPFTMNFSCKMDYVYWDNFGTTKQQYFGWQFLATSAHVDGLGSSIRFDLSPAWRAAAPNDVFSTLTVDAWIVNNNPGGVPNAVYQQSTEANWATFATALRWD